MCPLYEAFESTVLRPDLSIYYDRVKLCCGSSEYRQGVTELEGWGE